MNIKLEGLVKKFGTLEAVSHVSLDIQDGELFTLLGPSGCGKTTILRLIGGFHKPDHGEIYFGDRAVSSLPPYERNIGMVFQNYALWPHMTIANNIAYGLKLKKFSGSEIGDKISRALKLVNLTGLENRYPGQLSGGQQQRVALARALVLNPDVLLLDEPLSNLDAKIRIQVRAEIRKLQKDLGITTIYVTHDQEEALTLSDRIAVINVGKLQQIGSPRDLYERPENPFVADFIGINNLIPGEVQEINAAEKWMKAQTKVGTLVCAHREWFKKGDRCIISVRPETASIGKSEEGPKGYNLVPGNVSFASYIGNAIRYDVEINSGFLFKVDIQNPWEYQPYSIGEKVYIHFPIKTTLGIPA
ncbi:MAG: spermidine/putrescine ABC transporter ATP-binding protein [Deltaproteobacteria bacterium RBG_16_48_10]|nr:MAG: spermidine/putrescine ABC transporter ATP-binding protein [Deltaproteobacteria bacterium RBG_16_48_10]